MSFYLWIDIIIVSIPLLLSFEKKIFYFKKWPYVLGSVLIVGPVYIAWDILATDLAHWSFNPQYVGTARIFNLPIPEVLFFVVVPFSCIFIYEVVQYFSKDREIYFNKNIIYAFVFILMGLSLFYENQDYTSISLVFLAGFLFLSVSSFRKIVFRKNFFLYLAICYIPFLIFNGILTSIPVVMYNPKAIWGMRIFSIPIEDFIYNLTFLGFSVVIYKVLIDKKFS
ncbi:MAG: lycopene cyclase domain-containing protein [Candidatus Omnitrophica bacterium]|nr:lycopene cyclase domain-containing protein [Candidatus Omnitrophota bacterium]